MIINNAQIERIRNYGAPSVHIRDDQLRHFVLSFTSTARFEMFVNKLRDQLHELKADVPNAELSKEKESS